MFNPKTEKIKNLALGHEKLISKLDSLFTGKTTVYIDYANVRPWADKLRFHIDVKRLKQFFDSFPAIGRVNFYYGTLPENEESVANIAAFKQYNYVVQTKPVKTIGLSIQVNSLASLESPAILKEFIRKPLLTTFSLGQIENLNLHLQQLNRQGTLKLFYRKCNFDVEIGVDMLLDLEHQNTETFILWSGDSDFVDPIRRILEAKKRVVLFSTAGRVAQELNLMRDSGLVIFDVRDIEAFVCWNRELKSLTVKAQRTP